MMISPLNVRMIRTALPSPDVARMARPLNPRRRTTTSPGTRSAVPPMVNGRPDWIDPLNVSPVNSKPVVPDSARRTVPECELRS